jgi:hypothetical protein
MTSAERLLFPSQIELAHDLVFFMRVTDSLEPGKVWKSKELQSALGICERALRRRIEWAHDLGYAQIVSPPEGGYEWTENHDKQLKYARRLQQHALGEMAAGRAARRCYVGANQTEV